MNAKPPSGAPWLAWIGTMLLAIVLVLLAHFAHARDLGQWDAADPALRAWYQGLMQPDHPQSSCCGEADAYWCDEIHVRAAKTFCTITDDRPDGPLGRPHIAVGTEIEIPDAKLKWDRGNPAGHAIVFMSYAGYVFCFVPGGGA